MDGMPQPARRVLGAIALAVAVAGAVAGCGSTVQMRSTALGSDGLTPAGGSAQELTGAAGGSTSAQSGGATGSSAGGAAAGGAAGAVNGTAAPAAGGSSSSTGTASTGTRGVAAKEPIRIGVVYASGIGAAAAAMGIPGLATGDNKAQAEAVFNWINAHGGLGGHPIKGYYWDAAQNQGSNAEQTMQLACAGLTQDDHVQYVQSIAGIPLSGMACFVKAGVGILDDETGLGDADMAKYAAHLGNSGEIAPGRMTALVVDDLWQRGWLKATSKVGIFSADSSGAHSVVDQYLIPALRRHGLTSAKTIYVNPDAGDGGSSGSSSAALQYKAAGVDRIIPVLYSPLFLMHAASTQDYHPGYAVYSNVGPGALLETAAPPDQLPNAVGIGWQPYLDIGKGNMPGPVSPRETLCFDIMKKAGQASTSATTKGFEVQVCNALFYLMDLANKLPSMPADLLTSGRALIGRSFVPADTFRVDVTHRPDGVAGYRDLAYQQACGCFQYVSGVRSTP